MVCCIRGQVFFTMRSRRNTCPRAGTRAVEPRCAKSEHATERSTHFHHSLHSASLSSSGQRARTSERESCTLRAGYLRFPGERQETRTEERRQKTVTPLGPNTVCCCCCIQAISRVPRLLKRQRELRPSIQACSLNGICASPYCGCFTIPPYFTRHVSSGIHGR